MYAVAAASTRRGPPGIQAQGSGRGTSSVTPVGVRHAVPRLPGSRGYRFALCGTTVTGWVIMVDAVFAPEHAASCHRCAQLALSAQRRAQPAGPRGSAPVELHLPSTQR
jgi:hypothetical protein